MSRFQSTRPVRGATNGAAAVTTADQQVSIHAPRTGRDNTRQAHIWWRSRFQSTRPARGATTGQGRDDTTENRFQSTRPARGATSQSLHRRRRRTSFNPRAPHGARHRASDSPGEQRQVSIHAPRTGRDTPVRGRGAHRGLFQSTRPARGATSGRCQASRAEPGFNPRAPHGARRNSTQRRTYQTRFQSTRPARGATVHSQHGQTQ